MTTNIAKNHLFKMHLSGKGIPVDSLPSKTIQFLCNIFLFVFNTSVYYSQTLHEFLVH